MLRSRPVRALSAHWRTIVLAFGVLAGVVIFGTMFFIRSREALEGQLKERLRSAAAAAALQFDAAEVASIRSPADIQSPAFREIVERLQRIRTDLPEIRFAYILRRTENPLQLMFVADADALSSEEELDKNGNGGVDPEEEASQPGDLYDTSEAPALQEEAFLHPSTDPEITLDQWGPLISGYAPIRDQSGQVIAVLGIDMRAEDYVAITHSIFSPINFLLLLLGGALVAGWILRAGWMRQIHLLERINRERTNLLRLTYHQLGGPLTILKWALELLRDVEGDEKACRETLPQFTQYTQEGITRLTSVIDALEGAERVELGVIQYQAELGPLRRVIERAVQEVQSRLAAHRIHVTIDCPDSLVFPCDRAQLLTVFRKLLDNAIDYSEPGGEVTLQVSSDRKRVHVSLRDHGCGIPAVDLLHIGEKYIRASNASIHQPNGNGLSLYVSKGIIESAGGKLTIKSTEGKGTTVSFHLPLG